MFSLELRCNVCDSVLVGHWRVDTAGVFAHVDPCAKCAAQQSLALDRFQRDQAEAQSLHEAQRAKVQAAISSGR